MLELFCAKPITVILFSVQIWFEFRRILRISVPVQVQLKFWLGHDFWFKTVLETFNAGCFT